MKIEVVNIESGKFTWIIADIPGVGIITRLRTISRELRKESYLLKQRETKSSGRDYEN